MAKIQFKVKDKSFFMNDKQFAKSELQFRYVKGVFYVLGFGGEFANIEDVDCDGQTFSAAEDLKVWVDANLFKEGGGSGEGAVESVTGNLVSGTSSNPKVSLTGSSRDTVTFDNNGNPSVKPIGIEQLTDIAGFPAFANGVFVATAINKETKTALLSFIEFSTDTPKTGTFPTYIDEGRLPVGNAEEDGEAVSLSQLKSHIVEWSNVTDLPLQEGVFAVGIESNGDTQTTGPLLVGFQGKGLAVYDSEKKLPVEAGTNSNHAVNVSQLNQKANSASPSFTGTPTAPTAAVGTNTTQVATTAFVLANASSSASYATSADFTINKVGANFISTPRVGSGLVGVTNTDAYTVIQDAITKLLTVGGSIYLATGTYSLSNELTITGTSTDSPPTTSIAIIGSGFNTKIVQSTAGKHGIVVKNKASIIFKDFYVYSSATAKSCIYLSELGTSEVSVFGGTISNLYLSSNSTTDPAFKAVNYFDLNVDRLFASNDGNHGIQIINNSQNTNYGNSNFGLIRCSGKNSGTFAGLRIESTLVDYKYMNLNTFCNVNVIEGARGISIEGGCYNTFMHVDTEYMNNPIWIGGSDPHQSIGNKFLGGYLLVNEGVGVGITTNNYAVGNKFNMFLDSYDDTVVPVNDAESYGAPNEYNLELSYNLKPEKCSFGPQALVTIKDTASSSSFVKDIVVELSTSRNLSFSDCGTNKWLRATGGVTRTLTILNDSVLNLPIGSSLNIISPSAKTTIAGASGVNIISEGSLKSVESNCVGKLIKIGANEWSLSGKIVA